MSAPKCDREAAEILDSLRDKYSQHYDDHSGTVAALERAIVLLNRTRGKKAVEDWLPRGQAKNNAKKTHCKEGHPLFGDNLHTDRLGGRHCKVCHARSAREHAIKKRAERGLPPPVQRYGFPLKERLMASCVPVPDAGCWLWTAAWNKQGYGSFKIGRRTFAAHRVMYEELVGPIADGLFACHKCDTPACVNPAHIFLGTAQENMQDMIRKGRGRAGRASKEKSA